MESNIELRYLPIFYDDVKNAVDYISNNLKNVKAANDLIDLLETEIEKRRPIADSFHSFKSKKERNKRDGGFDF